MPRLRKTSGRTLHRPEALEERRLLAGDTFLVNFQNDEATIPQRYVRDTGLEFGPRGDGLEYGWTSDHTDQARERSLLADQRLDTLIHIEEGQSWEFALENGDYSVTIAVGDPSNDDGIHTVNVEGVNFFNAVPDTSEPMVVTMTVTVADGRLTIDQGDSVDKATRLNYAQIVGLAAPGNQAPATPLVTEPVVDGQVTNPADTHMEAVGYSDPEGDAHKSSDWQIWTTGSNPELAWETLGIGGVERLHTHLGDGVFVNSLAGQTELAENTDYELRVRFRDDAGAVSDWATRLFTTSPASTLFPLQLRDIDAAAGVSWTSLAGQSDVEIATGGTILSPGDAIIAIDLDGGSSFPGNESPDLAIDRTLAKYLNFGEVNSGFIVTPQAGASVVTSFQITTANDAEERDPTSWSLFGTNDTIRSRNNSPGTFENWTLIDSGTVDLPSSRDSLGPIVSVDNSTPYKSYRMVFTGVKNAAAANSMQIAEIQFFSDDASTAAGSLSIEAGDGSGTLLDITADPGPGNTITDGGVLASHSAVRVVLEAGEQGWTLQRTDLSFSGDDQPRTVFLPGFDLGPDERLDLWVDAAGSTYFGTPEQTEPDFSQLARQATLNVPYVSNVAGFVIEEVGDDYRLPVNIAFVPNPGPNPDDPLYYVTELYGSIQVVSRNGVKREFATGLLDYNPDGPISGSGEQGLTGITVVRDEQDPEIYHLFVSMLWDNGSPPGGAVHYPKVERISSVAGGLTMDSRTVLLNMQPETQGQSHQISNVSIGPDGKLYVHNGDGFNASTALDLNQYRGKVLRMNLDGTAPTDNPFYDAANGITARDYVFAYGLRNPFGGAWRASDGVHYQVENGPSVDRLSKVERGVSYGWNGSNQSMEINAIYNWSPATAPVNITFVQPETFGGSQFPASMQDHAFVAESGPTYAGGPQSRGKRITEIELDANGALVNGPDSLIEYVGTGRSSVVALAAGPDGLYFSSLYEDSGAAGPTASGAKLYRVRYVNPIQGDYDIDGDVDSDDYDVWLNNYGSDLLLAADGNGNGRIDAGDYTVWRDAFDAAQAAAVAEPVATAAASDSGVAALALAVPSVDPTTTPSGPISSPVTTTRANDAALLLVDLESDWSAFEDVEIEDTEEEGAETDANDEAVVELDDAFDARF